MIKNGKKIAVTVTLALSLAACGEGGPAAESPRSQEPAANAAAAASERTVELNTNATDQSVMTIGPGNYVSGEFISPENGTLTGFSILIGNYFNTSDGALEVELCQSGQCTTGTEVLLGSTDNAMFKISFDEPLRVVANIAVSYKITKKDGGTDVALWTFAPSGSIKGVMDPYGKAANAAPKINLTYSPATQ